MVVCAATFNSGYVTNLQCICGPRGLNKTHKSYEVRNLSGNIPCILSYKAQWIYCELYCAVIMYPIVSKYCKEYMKSEFILVKKVRPL